MQIIQKLSFHFAHRRLFVSLRRCECHPLPTVAGTCSYHLVLNFKKILLLYVVDHYRIYNVSRDFSSKLKIERKKKRVPAIVGNGEGLASP